MQVSREIILNRLRMVDGSCGSVIAVASWCALHCNLAQDIVSVWSSLMSNPHAAVDTRIGLLLVVHELLLCCKHRAASEAAIRQLVLALSKAAPNALIAAAQQEDPDGLFQNKLSVVLQAWQGMKVFPWIKEVRSAALKSGVLLTSSSGIDGGQTQHVPRDLMHVFKLHAQYLASKERLQRAKENAINALGGSKAATTEADIFSDESVAAAAEELRRRLIALLKGIESGDNSLAGQLKSELQSLKDCSAQAGKGEEDTKVDLQAEMTEEMADPLGSFF